MEALPPSVHLLHFFMRMDEDASGSDVNELVLRLLLGFRRHGRGVLVFQN